MPSRNLIHNAIRLELIQHHQNSGQSEESQRNKWSECSVEWTVGDFLRVPKRFDLLVHIPFVIGIGFCVRTAITVAMPPQ